MMKANGEIIYCSRQSNPEIFKAALLSLGSLGIIINVTLQCEPASRLHELVESATVDDVSEELIDFLFSNNSFSHLNCLPVFPFPVLVKFFAFLLNHLFSVTKFLILQRMKNVSSRQELRED